MRPGVKGTVTFWPAFFAACSMPAHPRKNDQVSEGDLLAAGGAVESALDTLQGLEDLRQLSWLIDAQSFCGARRMRAPFAPPRLSEPRNVDADAQAVDTSSDTDRPEARILPLRVGNVLFINQLVIDCGNGVLPDELLAGNLRAEIACARTHVAVCQLEPGASERVRELIRIFVEMS